MIICFFCHFQCLDFDRYDEHLYYIETYREWQFACRRQGCKIKFSTYNKYKIHIFRNHSKSPRKINSISSLLICKGCKEQFNNKKLLFHHLLKSLRYIINRYFNFVSLYCILLYTIL